MKKQLNYTYVLHKMNALLQKKQIELPNNLPSTATIDAFWKKVIDTQNLWKLRGKNYNDPAIE